MSVRAKQTKDKPDDFKLKELIIYLSVLSEGDKNFGAIKLNKLLFYADFMAYLRLGKSITGQEYQALPQGPAPKRMKPVLEQMKRSGDIGIRKESAFEFVRLRTVSIRTPDLTKFNGAEVNLVHETVQRFWNYNATEISDKSHDFLGWQLGITGETIPYSVALIGTRKPTEEECERGRNLRRLAMDYLAGKTT